MGEILAGRTPEFRVRSHFSLSKKWGEMEEASLSQDQTNRGKIWCGFAPKGPIPKHQNYPSDLMRCFFLWRHC